MIIPKSFPNKWHFLFLSDSHMTQSTRPMTLKNRSAMVCACNDGPNAAGTAVPQHLPCPDFECLGAAVFGMRI